MIKNFFIIIILFFITWCTNEVGKHSYSHKWLSKLKSKDIKGQINKTQDILKEEVNYVPFLLRPTYGSVNKKIRNNTKLEIILWNVDILVVTISELNKINKISGSVNDQ